MQAIMGKVNMKPSTIQSVSTLPSDLQDIRDHLVLDYDFGESSGDRALDQSGSQNHGVIVGAQRGNDLNFNGALRFDGIDDSCGIAHDAVFTTVPFSYYVEFEIDALPSVQGNLFALYDMVHSVSPLFSLVIGVNNANDRVVLAIYDSSLAMHVIHSDEVLVVGKKYRLVVTVDSAFNMKMFINGTPQSLVANCGSIFQADSILSIGSDPVIGWRLNGEIYSGKFWAGYALTQDDVDGLMDGKNVAENYLDSWWPCKEGTGAVLGDATGNGHDGTIQGATWIPRNKTQWGMRRLKFDGLDDYVDLGAFSQFKNLTDSFSMCALFKRYSVNPSWQDNIMGNWLYNDIENNRRGGVFGNYIDINSTAFIFETTDGVNLQTMLTLASTPVLKNWYFVVGTFNHQDRSARLYLDGELKSLAFSNPGFDRLQLDSPYDFHVGHSFTSNGFFPGEIALARIYDRALSAEEVVSLYLYVKRKYGLIV